MVESTPNSDFFKLKDIQQNKVLGYLEGSQLVDMRSCNKEISSIVDIYREKKAQG